MMTFNSRWMVIELIALELVLILGNLRASIFWPMFPRTSTVSSAAWFEIAVWLVPILLLSFTLARDGMLNAYFQAWKKNWLLSLFIAFCLASVFWSISFSASLYRVITLVFASLAGAYLGVRYPLAAILKMLFWFGAVVVILSIAFVLILPKLAIMVWPPYYDAWRGIYWHRNHLGSILAMLNAVFLMRAIDGFQKRQSETVFDLVFYILSFAVVYFARSATGYLLLFLLHGAVALAFFWLKISHRLHPAHYYGALAVFVAVSGVILLNLNFVLGLFNRSTSFTGRVPLWNYLLREVVSQRLWFGHGFGAIWTLASFRTGLQDIFGWLYPVVIGDNGFMDILLHVGVLGLILFIAVLVIAAVRSFRYAMARRNFLDFFPFILLFYAVVANISFSLFLETESFVWMLIVAILFLTAVKTDEHDTEFSGMRRDVT